MIYIKINDEVLNVTLAESKDIQRFKQLQGDKEHLRRALDAWVRAAANENAKNRRLRARALFGV